MEDDETNELSPVQRAMVESIRRLREAPADEKSGFILGKLSADDLDLVQAFVESFWPDDLDDLLD